MQRHIFLAYFHAVGDQEKEKAAKEIVETLKILEEKGLGEKKFFGGETIGLVDIAHGWLTHWFECMEDIIGVKVIEPNNLPRLCTWSKNFQKVPVIKENLPNHEELAAYMKNSREKFVSALPSHDI